MVGIQTGLSALISLFGVQFDTAEFVSTVALPEGLPDIDVKAGTPSTPQSPKKSAATDQAQSSAQVFKGLLQLQRTASNHSCAGTSSCLTARSKPAGSSACGELRRSCAA